METPVRLTSARSLACFSSGVRDDGWRATLARLSHGRSAEEEAAEYTHWVSAHTRSHSELEAHAARIAALPLQPLISIITPVFNTDAAVAARVHRVGPAPDVPALGAVPL